MAAIIGQQALIDGLQRLHQRNRLGHAIILSGPRGSGKKTMARFTVCLLNCGQPCAAGDCFTARGSTDLFWLQPDGRAIKISQLREVKEKLYYFPRQNRFKVCVIEEADLLTLPAANSLLMILEEPPPQLVFILLTARPKALPATIRSRCLHLPLPRLAREEIAALVQERRGVGREQADAVASLSMGLPGLALEITDDPTWPQRREQAFELLHQLSVAPVFSLLQQAEKIAGRADLDAFLEHLYIACRDQLVWQLTGEPLLIHNSDRISFFQEHHMPVIRLERALQEIADTRSRLAGSHASVKLALESMLTRLT